MELREMEDKIRETRDEFLELLNGNANEADLKEFLKEKLDIFAGQFEEQTLMENLKEAYGTYLELLAMEIGA